MNTVAGPTCVGAVTSKPVYRPAAASARCVKIRLSTAAASTIIAGPRNPSPCEAAISAVPAQRHRGCRPSAGWHWALAGTVWPVPGAGCHGAGWQRAPSRALNRHRSRGPGLPVLFCPRACPAVATPSHDRSPCGIGTPRPRCPPIGAIPVPCVSISYPVAMPCSTPGPRPNGDSVTLRPRGPSPSRSDGPGVAPTRCHALDRGLSPPPIPPPAGCRPRAGSPPSGPVATFCTKAPAARSARCSPGNRKKPP